MSTTRGSLSLQGAAASAQQHVFSIPSSCNNRATQLLQLQLGQHCQQACCQLHMAPTQHSSRSRGQLCTATAAAAATCSVACAATSGHGRPAVQQRARPPAAAVPAGAASQHTWSGSQCHQGGSQGSQQGTNQQWLYPAMQNSKGNPLTVGSNEFVAAVDDYPSSVPAIISSSNGNSAIWLLPYPAIPDSRQQLLCDALRISPAAAQLLLVTCPAASTLSRTQLAANYTKLQQLLPVPQWALLQAMLQLPDLLGQPEATIQARLTDAATVMQLPLQQLLSWRRRQMPLLHCLLLLMSQQQVEAKLSGLCQQLRLPWRQAAKAVCAAPKLLRTPEAQLVSTLEALEQVCCWPLSRLLPAVLKQPRLLVTAPGSLYQAAADLQQQLHLSELGLAIALRRAPAALLVGPGQLVDLLSGLSLGLSVSREVAADILLQEPELLMHGPGAVRAVLDVLRATFRLSSEELLQVVEFDPSLLACSPGELTNGMNKFKQLASSHRPWAMEYKRLMCRPVNVARAVRLEPLRLARLTYLVRQHLAATVTLKAAVSMSGRQFVTAYPGYKGWLAKHYSAGEVPRQYRF